MPLETESTHALSATLQGVTTQSRYFKRDFKDITLLLLAKDESGQCRFQHFEQKGIGRVRNYTSFADYLEDWSCFSLAEVKDLFHKDIKFIGALNSLPTDKQQEIHSRSDYAKAHPEKTQEAIADLFGVSQKTISNDLVRKPGMPEKVTKPRERLTYQIQTGTKPETAAARIRAKFGDQFASALMEALKPDNT